MVCIRMSPSSIRLSCEEFHGGGNESIRIEFLGSRRLSRGGSDLGSRDGDLTRFFDHARSRPSEFVGLGFALPVRHLLSLHPWLEASRSAQVQVWIWIIGTIIMAIGITLIQTGHTVGEPIVAVGSVTVLLDALFFG